jgi:hypothetical protein
LTYFIFEDISRITMVKKPGKTSAGAARNKRSAAPSSPDRLLRDHILYLLKDGGAHIDFDAAMGDWPLQFAGVKVANFPHTGWMLLEHMRFAQLDILEFSRNPKHAEMAGRILAGVRCARE